MQTKAIAAQNAGNSLKCAAARLNSRKERAMKMKAHILVFGAYAALTWRFFRMISQGAVNIFYYDQWDFNDATLFEKHTLWEIFRWQHGPHRQGLGGVAMKLLEPSIRWNSRYEAFGIGAIILAAAILALYLKTRLLGPIAYSDAIIPAFFLTPAQFETVLGATNPSWGAIPVLLIILYCLSWTIRSGRWKYVCVLLANFFLIYTGFGVFAGLLTPVVIALDYWKTRQVLSVAALLISIASLASFFVGYQSHHSAADCFSIVPANPILYAMFMSCMFGNAVGLKGSGYLLLLVGVIILIVSLVCLDKVLRRLRRDEPISLTRDTVIGVLLGFCLIFMLATAYGRLCLGFDFAMMPRYVTYTVLDFYGLYLFSLSIPGKRARTLLITTLCLLALLSSARMNRYDASLAKDISDGKRAWRDCYLGRHNIAQCNALANFQIYPFDEKQLQRKLDFLEQNHLNLFDGKN
jgi:hypothetical protein